MNSVPTNSDHLHSLGHNLMPVWFGEGMGPPRAFPIPTGKAGSGPASSSDIVEAGQDLPVPMLFSREKISRDAPPQPQADAAATVGGTVLAGAKTILLPPPKGMTGILKAPLPLLDHTQVPRRSSKGL